MFYAKDVCCVLCINIKNMTRTFAGYSPWKFPPDIISPLSANTIFVSVQDLRYRFTRVSIQTTTASTQALTANIKVHRTVHSKT